MSVMQSLVFASSSKELDKIVDKLDEEPIVKSYKSFREYLEKAIERRKEWALCDRQGLITRGNNTDNYTESMIFIFKCIIFTSKSGIQSGWTVSLYHCWTWRIF